MAILFFMSKPFVVPVEAKEYSLLLVTPYIILIALASFGLNVFIALVSSIAYACIIGVFAQHQEVIFLTQQISKGFVSMNEIMVLSLMVGGLSGLWSLPTHKSNIRMNRHSERCSLLDMMPNFLVLSLL